MEIHHNFFDSRAHEQEMREAAARRRELEAAQRILDTEANIGQEALANAVEVKPTETQERPGQLAA